MNSTTIKVIEAADKTIKISGSKAYSMFITSIASLAEGKYIIHDMLVNDDLITLINALEKIGVDTDFVHDYHAKKNEIKITGCGGKIAPYIGEIYLQNSATALHLMMSIVNLGKGIYFLSGDDRLKERLITDALETFTNMGISLKAKHNSYPPVLIDAKGFRGGVIKMDAKINTQLIASLLIAAPYGENPLEIEIEGEIKNNSIVDIAVQSMELFGVNVTRDGYKYFKVENNQIYKYDGDIVIEPDATIASYFFAVAALTSGRIRIDNIVYKDTKQKDIRFVDILEEMGCSVDRGESYIEVYKDKNKKLKGIEKDMSSTTNLIQLLCVVALQASSPTVIRGVKTIRRKEVDRIGAVIAEFQTIGAKIENIDEDTLKITPMEKYNGGVLDTYDDYRTTMALALIGTFVEGISILDVQSVFKIYPDFFNTLNNI